MNLENEFSKETGEDAESLYSDGVHHTRIKAPARNYVKWLEARAQASEEEAVNERKCTKNCYLQHGGWCTCKAMDQLSSHPSPDKAEGKNCKHGKPYGSLCVECSEELVDDLSETGKEEE